ncbi:hypothetical protein FA15DRAFT_711892, partial [Coprinopsis marcescibilis]
EQPEEPPRPHPQPQPTQRLYSAAPYYRGAIAQQPEAQQYPTSALVAVPSPIPNQLQYPFHGQQPLQGYPLLLHDRNNSLPAGGASSFVGWANSPVVSQPHVPYQPLPPPLTNIQPTPPHQQPYQNQPSQASSLHSALPHQQYQNQLVSSHTDNVTPIVPTHSLDSFQPHSQPGSAQAGNQAGPSAPLPALPQQQPYHQLASSHTDNVTPIIPSHSMDSFQPRSQSGSAQAAVGGQASGSNLASVAYLDIIGTILTTNAWQLKLFLPPSSRQEGQDADLSINVNDPSVQSFLRTSFNSAFSMTPYTVPAAKPHPPNEEDSDNDNTSIAPPPMLLHSTVHCARENESWFSELMSTILRNMALGFLLHSVLSSNINNSQVFQAQPVVRAIYNRLGLDFKDWNSTWDQNAQDLSLPAWQICEYCY